MAGPQRFFDQSQPQTLQIATFLLYLRAALWLLGGGGAGLVVALAGAGAGYGMANQRKWGYGLALGVAFFSLALPFMIFTIDQVVRFNTVRLMLDLALVALLLHPQSREYQRIWFS